MLFPLLALFLGPFLLLLLLLLLLRSCLLLLLSLLVLLLPLFSLSPSPGDEWSAEAEASTGGVVLMMAKYRWRRTHYDAVAMHREQGTRTTSRGHKNHF